MFKKIVFTVSFVIISLYGTAQKDINSYKYILIPKKFEISKSDDQYQLNSLTKFLFNKYGYETYFLDDDLPEDLKNERCLALTTEVSNKKGGMFKTKVVIVLKDCFGDIVVTSQEGESRIKEFKKAYTEAIRQAFVTFQNLDYKYVPAQKTTIKPPINETITLKESKIESPKDEVDVIKDDVKNEIVEAAVVVNNAENKTKDSSELHYTQAIKNGYQLVNAEPKVVMILLHTAAKDVYLVKDKNAIIFKKDGQWIYSENNGISTLEKVINIKF